MVTWTERPLGEIVTVTQGHTFSQKYQGFSQGRWDYFKVADIGDPKSSKYLYRAINRVETDVLQLIGATTFPKGSIVFPRVGAALLNNNKRILAVDGVTDDNVLVLTVIDETRYYNEYVYYWLCLQDLATFCNEGLVPVIASKNVRSRLVAVPPFNEQKEIAKTLSDVDAYIAALEKLIVKKRAVKQGAMQELLAGKRRLPGFSREWVKKPLDRIFRIKKNRKNPYRAANCRCIELEHIEQGTGRLLGWMNSKNQLSLKTVFSVGDILFGKLRPYLKKYLISSFEGLCSTEFWVLTSYDNTVSNRYIYLLVQTDRFIEVSNSTTGTKMPRADWSLMKEIEFAVPTDTDEQTAIAEVLSDMDAEIDALTAKQNKAKHIKQGMMSDLLTGRIRLVETDSAEVPVEAIPEREVTPIHQVAEQSAIKSHSKPFDDAIMIAGIVNTLYSDKYPLGRKKVQKCLYLLRRHQDESTTAFKKKAAGPYADEVRYKGGEPIAIGAGYIATTTSALGTIFAPGNNIAQALGYIEAWGKQGDIKWVADNLMFKGGNELELLTTVDMAICDLAEAGTPVTVASIKHLIANNAEWQAKLKKQTFSDINIQLAMKELRTLL